LKWKKQRATTTIDRGVISKDQNSLDVAFVELRILNHLTLWTEGHTKLTVLVSLVDKAIF
jgi:hypothetical protein